MNKSIHDHESICRESTARSTCTYDQSDLALLPHPQFLSTKLHPMPLEKWKCLCARQEFQSEGVGSGAGLLIDCMVFNAVLNSVSVTLRRPVHQCILSWSSFNQCSAQYSFFPASGCFPT